MSMWALASTWQEGLRNTQVEPGSPSRRRNSRIPTLDYSHFWLLYWTLRILSGISEGICNTMVQSGGEFLYIGVGGR